MTRPDNGLPEDIREHMRLMCDIIALAVPDRQDAGRHAAHVPRYFRALLSVPRRQLAHHLASHEDTSDAFTRINQFYLTQYAYLASQLAAMPEGESTVLDNSCLMFMSNMWSGSNHDSSKVPVLTAGTLGGTLETGRVLDYTTAGDENRKLCSLYLSLMDRMDVKLDRFGDAAVRLDGI